jgi:hypothetical protein
LAVHIAHWRLKKLGCHLMMFDSHMRLVHGNVIRWWPNVFGHQIFGVLVVLGYP